MKAYPWIFRRRRGERGVALVIVLVALVLVSVLVLAFLSGVGSELQSSKMYADGSSVKLLAQSSVALVTGEIQAATSNSALCWASQPGMIRTYNNDGTPNGYYKLYSDDGMGGTGPFNHALPGLVPDGSNGSPAWYAQKGVYVDLNEPIFLNGTDYYPIIDGNVAHYATTYTNPLATKTLPAATATISTLTPVGSNGLPAVTGFWLNSKTPVNSASPNVAPMPVRWLYVLKNGEIIAPNTAPTGGNVTFPTVSAQTGLTQAVPTQDDPIVGRIAFWTDDETCKVNLNTASEGKYWDTPRAYTLGEVALANSQPAQNEFQRYPGHPATVSLSAVFNSLSTQDSGYPENIYPLTPRTAGGGSQGGTVAVSAVADALSMRTTRLYSTPDEFLFQAKISGNAGTGTRDLNSDLVTTPTSLNPAAVQQASFFLTTSSSAPDVNVFNLPRLSMWPITLTGGNATGGQTQAVTAYDKLISFCSTISGNKYYFQRWDPTSPNNDLPVTGNTPSNLLARNRDLLEYLRFLVGQASPGFGGNLKDKYGLKDSNQILVEMFDYIRSTNLQDSSTGATPFVKAFSTAGYLCGGGLGQVVPIMDKNPAVSIIDSVGGAANFPRGFGRFPTLQQAAIAFIGAGDCATDPSTGANPPSSYTPRVAPPDPGDEVGNHQRVQAGFFFQMFNPALGVGITRPWYQVKVSHLDNLRWNGVSIFPVSATFPYVYNTNGTVRPTAADINGFNLVVPPATGNGFQGFSYGGLEDFRQFWILRDSVTGGSPTALGHWGMPVYPFISPPTGQPGTAPDFVLTKPHPALPLDPVNNPLTGTFNFASAGDVVMEIYALDASGNPSSSPIQTINLTFPNATLPVPYSIDNNLVKHAPYNVPPYTTPPYFNIPTNQMAPPPPYSASTFLPNTVTASPASLTSFGATDPTNYNFLSFLGSYGGAPLMGSGRGRLSFSTVTTWLSTCDVVRALVATPGDIRLIAARQYVPSSFLQPIISTGSNGIPAAADYNVGGRFSHMLRFNTTTPFYNSIGGRLISSASAGDDYLQLYTKNPSQPTNDMGSSTYNSGGGSGLRPKDNQVPNQASSVTGFSGFPGDWDNGFENASDGPYINKADEGDTGNTAAAGNNLPYFELDYNNQLPGNTFFSPNRMIPSSAMFGSLPTGVWANHNWQTLLFRPGPAGHPGLGVISSGASYSAPPDHLYLDLFNMPVVEPYAISTPLATSGRINMNYLIVPFTYINRDTGLRAVLKSQMVTVIPAAQQANYKSHRNPAGAYQGNSSTLNIRQPVNMDSTLSQFLARFYNTTGSQGANGAPDIFRSASEICNIEIVPADTTSATSSFLNLPITRANMDTYWVRNALTGDNCRERPYANIYPLLTTKSNTFTVHFRVQALKQSLMPTAAASAWNTWREGKDLVTSEYRGSQTIERYVDPNAAIPDYATAVVAANSVIPDQPLSQFYKFRVISSKQFPP